MQYTSALHHMSTSIRYLDFKSIRVGPKRREMVRTYMQQFPHGFTGRVSARAGVHRTVVSKVLHGRAVSANVEAALQEEEKEYEKQNAS